MVCLATNIFSAKLLSKRGFPLGIKYLSKVTIFSNLLPSTSTAYHVENISQISSSQALGHGSELTQTRVSSPTPYASQHETLLKPIKSMTSQQPNPTPHTPRSIYTHSQTDFPFQHVTTSLLPPIATRIDTSLHIPLNALSLF